MTREEALTEIKERVHVAEYVDSSYVDCVDIEALRMAIKALEQPEPQWVPVTERLPEPFEYCLWTTTDGRVVYHHCDGLFSNYTAWMPLPEPWEGERNERA